MTKKRYLIYLSALFYFFIFNLHGQDIKVMSYNMQQPYGTNWDSRVDNAASIINTHQPDILGTQELHGYMRDQILGGTSGYSTYGISRECDGSGESSYIFYKTNKYDVDYANSGTFWLKDDYWNCGRGYDPDYNRVVTYVRFRDKATGNHFYVYNSHFPMVSYHGARVQSAELLCQRAINRAIKDPVIFTGDFNSTEGEINPIEYIKNGSSLKMRDTYREVYPTGSVTTGFGTRLDYIFIENQSSNSTLSTYVVNSPVASDHLPIVATVRIGGHSNLPIGQTIWLQNGNKYVSSNDGGSPITCDRPSVQDWEKFLVVDAGGGRVALKGSNGKYVSCENGYSAMTCNRVSYDDWEKFEWIAVSSDEVALFGFNNKYVSSENGSTSGMNCNRHAYQGWEVFRWGTANPSARVGDEVVELSVENSFYPNPCVDKLTFANSEPNVSLSIYSLSGHLLLDRTYKEGKHDIDVSDFKEGIYVAKVQKEGQTQTVKLYKK